MGCYIESSINKEVFGFRNTKKSSHVITVQATIDTVIFVVDVLMALPDKRR